MTQSDIKWHKMTKMTQNDNMSHDEKKILTLGLQEHFPSSLQWWIVEPSSLHSQAAVNIHALSDYKKWSYKKH